MQPFTTAPLARLRLALITLLLVSTTSCATVLTTWHDKAYTPVVALDSQLVERADKTAKVEQTTDLRASADELYSQGYVLVGYTKFSHTLIPGIQKTYARMYGERLGAERVLQEEPHQDGNVFAYTVTYWAKGKRFPFGAYYNDLPDETVMSFPDSLREVIGPGRPVLVEAVVQDSPAQVAGVQQGELIVAVDGEPIEGSEGLDALIPAKAGREVALTVWGLSGLRETSCTLGERLVCAQGYGTEGLYFNQPWAFDDYANFQQYSQAFSNAWHAGFDAHAQAQEQARRDAQYAYMSSEITHLQGQLDDLERRPSRRGTRPTVEGLVDYYKSQPQSYRDRHEFWRD